MTVGMCVALLGPDGAGKTTVGRSLADHLAVEVRYVYSGTSPDDGRFELLKNMPGGSRILRFARVAQVGIRARFYRRRGYLVVLDRCPQEMMIAQASTPLRARLRLLAVRVLAPMPELVILLDAPAELLFARKGEHSVEILEGMRKGYHALLGQFPAGAVVDARSDADSVRRRVTEIIGEHWPASLAA